MYIHAWMMQEDGEETVVCQHPNQGASFHHTIHGCWGRSIGQKINVEPVNSNEKKKTVVHRWLICRGRFLNTDVGLKSGQPNIL
jgi:hypothetical protein